MRILFLDTLIGVSKLGVVLLALYAGWLGFSKYVMTLESRQKESDTAMVAPQAIESDKQISGSEQAVVQLAENMPAATEISIDSNATVEASAVSVEEPAVVATSTSRVVGERWILSQDSSSFILQFGSSLDDIELIKEFVPIIKSDQPIAIFQFKKTQTGEPVYGVASGVFADLESALASIELLTDAERQYDPWVRPLRELQRQVSTVVASSQG